MTRYAGYYSRKKQALGIHAGLVAPRGTERTKEIGLRMAVRAGACHIPWQLLFEGIMLSLLGGCVGSLLGRSASMVVWYFLRRKNRACCWNTYSMPARAGDSPTLKSTATIGSVGYARAGAMSMAAGGYVSVSSQADAEKADLDRETRELETHRESQM